jgi:hypothetical protein
MLAQKVSRHDRWVLPRLQLAAPFSGNGFAKIIAQADQITGDGEPTDIGPAKVMRGWLLGDYSDLGRFHT